MDAGGRRWRNTAGGRQDGGGGPTAGKHVAAVVDADAGGRDGQVEASGDGAAATGTRQNSNAGADF